MRTNPFLYVAIERFDKKNPKWESYICWSGLSQLRELITLDATLCERVISELSSEDWLHNVHETNLQDFFWDIEYLLTRISHSPRIRILAVQKCPVGGEMPCVINKKLIFSGYDIMDEYVDVSLLTNCGRLPLAFERWQLNAVGLINDITNAKQIQKKLVQHYSSQNCHVHKCTIWGIWEMQTP